MNQPETDTLTDQDAADLPGQAENNSQARESRIVFFPVSEDKLFTLYILSFGLYGIYWFYRNWKLQQPAMDKKIYPLWRAIFSIFFTHALFKRINRQASHLQKKHRFHANALATFYVITIVASHLADHLYGKIPLSGSISASDVIVTSLILFVLSVYPLMKVQATVNRINNDILGFINNKYSLFNYLLIATGTAMWLLLALGLLIDYMGLVTTR